MPAAQIFTSIRCIYQPHCTGRTCLKFEPFGVRALKALPQLRRVQCRLYKLFVIDTKPLNEKASVVLTICVPSHVACLAG